MVSGIGVTSEQAAHTGQQVHADHVSNHPARAGLASRPSSASGRGPPLRLRPGSAQLFRLGGALCLGQGDGGLEQSRGMLTDIGGGMVSRCVARSRASGLCGWRAA